VIAALENIFGGEPTLNSYDGYGNYTAFINGGGGGGGGYVPPVTPNPTYVPTNYTNQITNNSITITLLSNSGEVEFLENGINKGYGISNTITYSPSSTFNGIKRYEVRKEGTLPNQYFEVEVTKTYQPQNYTYYNTYQPTNYDFYGYNRYDYGYYGFNYNITPNVTAIDYSYSEILTLREWQLQSDGTYQFADSRTFNFGSVPLTFTLKPIQKNFPIDVVNPIDQITPTQQMVEYEIGFSSNLKNELGKNVILDYTIFSSNGNIIGEGSIDLETGNTIKQIDLNTLNNSRVDFKIRYNNLPSNYFLKNIYQTSNPSALAGVNDSDYSKWTSQSSVFSVPGQSLKTGISVVTLFEKEIQVERPSIEINDVYKQISVQVKESDDDKTISIPFKTQNADNILIYINGNDEVITIPASNEYITLSFKKDFGEIYGSKKVVLLAKSDKYGTGDSATSIITFNSVNDFPSITEINFPQNIDVPSFSDFNIEYKVEYTSFSTTTIDVDLLLKDKRRIGLFKNLNPNGEVLINLKTLREKFPNWTGSDNVTLVFKPFNRGGAEELIGNEYEVITTLGLPAFQFDENIFSTVIFDAFAEKLSVIEPEKENKYLSHLTNFGNDEQILISSWENDNWTLSKKETDEIGNVKITNEVDSLILKLYTPLNPNISVNSTLWITKLMSNPLIETIVLTEQDDVKCPPIKGPNFNIDADFVSGQSTTYESLDNLILSGSTSSAQLVSTYLTSSLINTDELNVEYASGSDYLWNNFVHFSSAKERVDNFVYKVQLIEVYETAFNNTYLTGSAPLSGSHTGSISAIQERQRQQSKKDTLIAGFDGFEKFLYESSSMGWPYNGNIRLSSSDTASVTPWYDNIITLAEDFDIENPNYVLNNIPEYIVNNEINDQFTLFFTMVGQHFDNIYFHTKAIERSRGLGYKAKDGVSDKLLFDILKSFNWDAKNLAADSKLWEYAFGIDVDGNIKNENPAKQRTYEVWRRIVNNLPYLLKHKGTRRGIYALLSCYGIPSSNLSILEFGGPEVSEVGKSKLVFDNLTYGLKMNNGSYISIDWLNTNQNRKPDTIEFFVKPSVAGEYNIVSGSGWGVHISGSTNQNYGRVILNYSGSNAISSSLLPIFNGRFFGVEVSREVSSSYHNFELNLRQADKDRTIFEDSKTISVLATNSNWNNGSNIRFGNDFVGTTDEFRLWSTPLNKERFYEHVSFPEMINGNHISSSTDDLHFRLDFEYPKDLSVFQTLPNVDTNIYFAEGSDRAAYESGSSTDLYSINPSASFSASVAGFNAQPNYPYQFEAIDRSVVLEVPDMGSSRYSTNKVRFEEQTLVSDLSSKGRATKKAFDQSPTDSNRVGLFFSPTKELNIDIAKSFGGINLDNYIGDPSDRYKDSYRNLDKLRHYYFQRFDGRDIYSYINLIKLYEKSMFEDIKKMLPARVKASTGLLIEPHILERSKHQYSKPVGEHNNYESVIQYGNELLSAEYTQYDVVLDTESEYSLIGENNQYTSTIQSASAAILDGESYQHISTIDAKEFSILEGNSYQYTASIGSMFNEPTILTEIDLINSSVVVGQSDYENVGFGIYAQSGSAIRTYYDKDGNLKKERVRVQIIKETKTREYVYLTGSVGVSGLYNKIGTDTYIETKLNIQPFSGSHQFTSSNANMEVIPLNGYLKTHYRNTSDLTRGLQNSFYNGSKNTAATTLDGTPPVETFLTNPNTLRVNKAGRDASEPILEVE